MKITRHVLLVITIYTLVVLIGVIAYGFFVFKMPENLFGSSIEYRMYSIFLLFFELIPSVLLSSFLIGYSWAFGRNSNKTVKRFSLSYIEFVKSIFLVGILCIALCVITKEFSIPFIQQKQDKMYEVTEKFSDYYELAQYYTNKEDYSLAKFYIDNALALIPQSEEALSLSDEIGICFSSVQSDGSVPIQPSDDTPYEENEEYTVLMLLDKSQRAFSLKEYFDAHYYASLALEIAGSDDGNIDTAKKLASESWNMLSENSGFINDESMQVFERKKEGYFALMNDDFEKAYYIYNDLLSQYPLDLDIQRYHSIAYEKMNSTYFFIDETDNLQLFEQYEDIYFSNTRIDGGKDVIYMKGCTAIKKTGSILQYLRGFSLYSFDKEGQLQFSFSVPYVKMTSLSLDYTDPEFQRYMSNLGEEKIVPYIYLESVDRNKKDVFLQPEFSFEDGVEPIALNHYVLSLPYDDFKLICESSMGAKMMPLLSLLKFAKKAQLYGYSTEVYFQALLSRLTYPLILFIVFIFTAALSWNYRLNSELLFKFKWLFTLPLFTFIAFILLDTILYLLNLSYYVLLSLIGTASLYVAVILLVIMIFISTVLFTALRAE